MSRDAGKREDGSGPTDRIAVMEITRYGQDRLRTYPRHTDLCSDTGLGPHSPMSQIGHWKICFLPYSCYYYSKTSSTIQYN